MMLLIIEDENPAAGLVTNWLEQHFPEIKLLGIARTLDDARKRLKEVEPDIIVMDVNLRGENSIELFDGTIPPKSRVIFTTAYRDYAADAFRFEAVDYLTKPLQEGLFIKAIEKAISIKEIFIDHLRRYRNENGFQKLVVYTPEQGYLFIPMDDIICANAEGAYSKLVLKSGQYILSTSSLTKMEDSLTDFFCRIRHGSIINMNEIEKYSKGDNPFVKMSNGMEIFISFRKRKMFNDRLNVLYDLI